MRTIKVSRPNGKPVETECFGQFFEVISGERYKFAVTRSLDRGVFTNVVTHVSSGRKVCDCTIGGAYLHGIKRPTDVEIGRRALAALVDRVGAARVRSVLDAAPKLADER